MSGSVFDGLGLDNGSSDMGLLGLLQGLGAASGASRLPVSNGSALGMAAAGLAQGQQNAQRYQLGQEQLRSAQLQNAYNAIFLPAKAQGQVALAGLSGGGAPSTGVPAMLPSAGGASGVSGSPSGMVMVSGPNDPSAAAVRELIQRRNIAQLSGDSGSVRAYEETLRKIAGDTGIAANDGSIYQVPGAAQSRFAASQASAAGNVAPETQLYSNRAAIDTAQAGPRATAEAAARAPYQPPITITAPGADGVLRDQQIPVPAWAAQNGAGNAPAGASGIPAADFAQRVQRAENAGGNPSATNPNSSAMGNAQFLTGTFVPLARQMFPQQTQGMSDDQVAQLRANPAVSQAATIAYAQQNAGALQQAGLSATGQSLGLAHRFGPQGAIQLLRADPQAPVSSVLPAPVIRANPDLATQTVGRVVQNAGLNFGYSPVALGNSAASGATTSGASSSYAGKPVMTPEQTALSESYGKQAGQIMDAGAKAPTSLQRLDVIENATQGFRPGTSGGVRLSAAKATTDALQSLGITPPAWISNGAASGETISKEGGYLASEMTRQLGSREAAAVFNQVRNIQPNIEMSSGGFQVITNSLRQGVQRDQDLAQFQEQWLSDPSHNGSIKGMLNAFEQGHPVEAYASRVVPYPLPKSAAQAKPNVIYQTARGPALWTGNAFQSVQ